MTPTEEQFLIINAAKLTKDNILVNALAGAAKTTTLEMIAKALPSKPILFLAFNKRIADEAQKRLPSHMEVRTLNALGHRIWGKVVGKQLVVKSTKMGDLYHTYLNSLKGMERSRAWDERSEILDLLREAKKDGFIPPGARSIAKSEAVEWSQSWWNTTEESSSRIRALVEDLLGKSILASFSGLIDYDDQIYMPVCFPSLWPKYPLVLIDEAQDLSPINHEMLSNLFYKRIIAVGDPWQSIYGFRGSVFNGMQRLKERFSMKEMTLSVTFRVPKAGVLRARERVPEYKWPDWLEWPTGEVVSLSEWGAAKIPAGSAILCRNNAPLFSCALRLLGMGRKIKLVGMEIGPGLLRIMKKLGPPTATELDALIEAWEQAETSKGKNPARVSDKGDCLRVLCADRKNLTAAIAWTEDLFKQDGDIQLLSIHKAKGLEWDVVYHLDPWRIPSRYATTKEDLEQEKNLKYVAETRFKKELYLVDLVDLRN